MMNKILGIAALTIIAALGLTVWLHGNARYAEGKADCVAEQATIATDAANNATKNLEKRRNETNRLSDADVDAGLSDLGIMRQPTDY